MEQAKSPLLAPIDMFSHHLFRTLDTENQIEILRLVEQAKSPLLAMIGYVCKLLPPKQPHYMFQTSVYQLRINQNLLRFIGNIVNSL